MKSIDEHLGSSVSWQRSLIAHPRYTSFILIHIGPRTHYWNLSFDLCGHRRLLNTPLAISSAAHLRSEGYRCGPLRRDRLRAIFFVLRRVRREGSEMKPVCGFGNCFFRPRGSQLTSTRLGTRLPPARERREENERVPPLVSQKLTQIWECARRTPEVLHQ